jgi:Bifunctional DNA primase/polymerase, N-terminal
VLTPPRALKTHLNYTPTPNNRTVGLSTPQSSTLDIPAQRSIYPTKIFPIKRNGKASLTKQGFKDASSDPLQIAQWEQEHPDCNWGMPTGEEAGVVVLDLDAKHPESFQWWREQQDINTPVETLEVATPSGGIHLYFLTPEIELKSTASQPSARGGYSCLWRLYRCSSLIY